MEAENSDLLDRRLMSLYGIQDGKPSKMDQDGQETRDIQAYKGPSKEVFTSLSANAPT